MLTFVLYIIALRDNTQPQSRNPHPRVYTSKQYRGQAIHSLKTVKSHS